MDIHVFPCGPFETNAYVVVSDGKALVIDPGFQAWAHIKECLKDLEVVAIVLTHTHWDHIAGCGEVKRKTSAPVLCHKEDTGNLEKPGSDRVMMPPLPPIEPVTPDRLVDEGDEISVGALTFKVLHTPGHCPGSVCLYSESDNLLFCGDLFFHQSIGTLAVPTAEPERMWPSLMRVATLPSTTQVYPGHGPDTTIGDEPWLANARSYFG